MGCYSDVYGKKKKEVIDKLTILMETRKIVLETIDKKMFLLRRDMIDAGMEEYEINAVIRQKREESESFDSILQRVICQNHNLRG